MPRTNHRRSRRSSSRRHSSRRGMIAALVALPIVAIGGGIAAMDAYINDENVAMTADYCYPQQDQHQASYFVDFSLTSDTSAQQQRDLLESTKRAYQHLPANGRISFFTTARDSGNTVVKPVFSLCRPAATVAEQEKIGVGNKTRPQLAHDDREALDAYMVRVEKLMEDASNPALVAKDSPILESIRSISRYYPPGALDVLDIYTDGIQNSRAKQFCRTQGHLPPFKIFSKSRDYEDLKPDRLDGVKVNFWLVEQGRLPAPGALYCTNREIREFWPAFFDGQGAITRIEFLAYGAS